MANRYILKSLYFFSIFFFELFSAFVLCRQQSQSPEAPLASRTLVPRAMTSLEFPVLILRFFSSSFVQFFPLSPSFGYTFSRFISASNSIRVLKGFSLFLSNGVLRIFSHPLPSSPPESSFTTLVTCINQKRLSSKSILLIHLFPFEISGCASLAIFGPRFDSYHFVFFVAQETN